MLLKQLIAILFVIYSAKCIQVLHLADFHMDIRYSQEGDPSKMCHGNSSNATLGPFGDYMCDSPKSLVGHALSEATRIAPSPDLLIWTGDNVPHVDDYALTDVFKTLNLTSKMIFDAFPNVSRILPTFGNHDYSPSGGFIDNSLLYKWSWEIWKDKIGLENQDTFLKGGYYKQLWMNSTILVLNTNVYYVFDGAYDNFTDKHDPMGQFAFMEKELMAAKSCKEPVTGNCTQIVNILAHIAPGAFERSINFTWFRDEYNAKFVDLIRNYSSQIGWMIFGHHHTDTFHLVKDTNAKPIGVLWMTPAVTPWFSSLPGAGSNNPSFRTFEIDENSQIRDFTTYYLSLDDLNADNSTKFVEEYSFKDAYDIQENIITPDIIEKLVENMKTDDDLFMKYIRFNSVKCNATMPTGIYRGLQLCSLEYTDYPGYWDCMKPYMGGSTRHNSLIGSFLFSLVASFIVFC